MKNCITKIALALTCAGISSIALAEMDCTASIKKICEASGHAAPVSSNLILGPNEAGQTIYHVEFAKNDPFKIKSLDMFMDRNCDLIEDQDFEYWWN